MLMRERERETMFTSGRPRVNANNRPSPSLAVSRMRSSPRVCTLVLFIVTTVRRGEEIEEGGERERGREDEL